MLEPRDLLLVPVTDAIDSLGSPTNRYKNAYFSGSVDASNITGGSLTPSALVQTDSNSDLTSSNTVTQAVTLANSNTLGTSGTITPPSTQPTVGGYSTSGYLESGSYVWNFTYVSASGETTGGTASSYYNTGSSLTVQLTGISTGPTECV